MSDIYCINQPGGVDGAKVVVPEPHVVAGVPGDGGVVGRLPEGTLDRLREEHFAGRVRVVHAQVEPAVLQDDENDANFTVTRVILRFTSQKIHL